MPNSPDDRLTMLEQQAAITSQQLQYRASERAQDFLQLQKLIDTAVDLRVSQRVLETRVGIYAALGGFFGGGAMAIIVTVLIDLIRH